MSQDLVALKKSPKTIEMSSELDLIKRLVQAQETLKYWQDRVNDYKGRLKELAGDSEVLLVNGEPVFTNLPTVRINQSEFKKAEPTLYEAYQREVTKSELDEELIRKARPDLMDRFAVRQFRQVQ